MTETVETRQVVNQVTQPDIDVTRFPERDLERRIGLAVQRLREFSKLTQNALASTVGISQPAISQIECGKRTHNLNTLESIALALGLPLSDLIRIAEHPTNLKEFIEETLSSLDKL